MRSQYATDVSSGFLDEVHGVLSSASAWGTGGGTSTVPRRHLETSPTPPPRAKTRHSRTPAMATIDEMFSVSTDDSNYDNVSQPETLSDALRQFKVMPHSLDRQYRYARALHAGSRSLLSVAPSALALLEIFPPALHTFNIVVPSLLSSPHHLLPALSSPPSRHVALAMYFASKSAQCTYSTLHTCAFALRRGASEGVFNGSRRLSAREAAVAAVATNMCSFPPALSFADRTRLHSLMSRAHVGAVVLAVAMTALLNLSMTALSVDLDKGAVDAAAVLARASGWSSGNHRIIDPARSRHPSPPRGTTRPERRATRAPTRARSLRSNISAFTTTSAPTALSTDVPRSVPKTWPAVGDFLVAKIGHSFPIFSQIRSTRAIRALATALCINLDETECSIDVEIKYLAAVVYATLNGNHLLSTEFQALAQTKSPAITKTILTAVTSFAADKSPLQYPLRNTLTTALLTPAQKRLLYVAKACSMSPPVISRSMVKVVRDNMLPPQIVELVTWLGLIATFHRLYVFYFPNCLDRSFLHEAAMRNDMDDDDVISDMS